MDQVKPPALFRFTRTSAAIFSGFVLLLFLIGYVWWPLVEEYLSTYNPEVSFWLQMDWLLLGIFAVMSVLLMVNARISTDLPLALIGLGGGFVIESWGTQTGLWAYFTGEKPPLWIIPAWAIATLSIDRLFILVKYLARRLPERPFSLLYWPLMMVFYALMLAFVAGHGGTADSLTQPMTLVALGLCTFLILTPTDKRAAVLIFFAGAGLGYFLECWGTTRECWVYYTRQTPPLFAVLAHGMAAVAFWRVYQLYLLFSRRSIMRPGPPGG